MAARVLRFSRHLQTTPSPETPPAYGPYWNHGPASCWLVVATRHRECFWPGSHNYRAGPAIRACADLADYLPDRTCRSPRAGSDGAGPTPVAAPVIQGPARLSPSSVRRPVRSRLDKILSKVKQAAYLHEPQLHHSNDTTGSQVTSVHTCVLALPAGDAHIIC
jgi:hypothetical protein